MTGGMASPGRPRGKELTEFGKRLRAAIERSDAFESRAAFVRHHGLEGATLYRYEVGERPPPLPLVKEFAKSLGVSVSELVDDSPSESTLQRDEDLNRALEAFVAGFDPDDTRGPTPEEIAWLRRLSFRELRLAGMEVTATLYDRTLRERRLQESGRISRGQTVEVPVSDDTMDLPEPKRRR